MRTAGKIVGNGLASKRQYDCVVSVSRQMSRGILDRRGIGRLLKGAGGKSRLFPGETVRFWKTVQTPRHDGKQFRRAPSTPRNL